MYFKFLQRIIKSIEYRLTTKFGIKIMKFFSKSDNFRVFLRVADANLYQENTNKNSSIIFWTTHKCASTYISNFLSLISKISNFKYFDYAEKIAQLGSTINLKDPYQIERNSDFLYRSFGEIYGPMRTPFDFKKRNELNNIFFLRDPRDLLVSMYYSAAYSHPIPHNKELKKLFLKRRDQIKKNGINNFFIEQLDEWIIPCFNKYKLMRNNSLKSSFWKYEDLINNPKGILTEMALCMNVDVSEQVMQNLVKDFKYPFEKKLGKETNNIYSHTRSGKTRQFENEIEKEIIMEANIKLKAIIEYWGFEI